MATATAKRGEILRAIPDREPGTFVCQNLTKASEYDVDVNAWTCTCLGFEHRGNCKHLEYCREKVISAAKAAEPTRTERLRQAIREKNGPLSPADELKAFLAAWTHRKADAWSEMTEDEKKRVFA